MTRKKRVVIIGATSAIAEHCVRIWIEQQDVEITLVGRNENRIQRVANDLRARRPEIEIECLQTNFESPQSIQKTVESIFEKGAVDIALIAHGSLSNQSHCQNDIIYLSNELYINGISPVLFAEAFAGHMEHNNNGALILLGSVAGDRGRQYNYAYGAAKGLITRYAEGLQHRLATTKVKVTLIKPGPTDTPMTYHLKELGSKLAPVDNVAVQIVEAVNLEKKIAYIPKKWLLIMMIIRHLPQFIFNKLKI